MTNEHITDEREAFIQWLSETYPYVYDKEKAANHWRNKHVSALAWQARAALLPAAQPAPVVPADQDAATWCEYVAGMVDHWVRTEEYASIKADEDRCTKAIAGIIKRRMWALKREPAPAPQPVAVPDRVPMTDEQMCVIRFLLGESGIDGCHFGDMHPDKRGRFWWREHLRSAFGITTPKADK